MSKKLAVMLQTAHKSQIMNLLFYSAEVGLVFGGGMGADS